MAYRRQSEVLSSIRKRVHARGGDSYTAYEAYFGVDPFSGKPVRKYATTKTGIERVVTEFFRSLSAGGEAAVYLDRDQAADAKRAIDLLIERNVRMSLFECAKLAVEREDAASVPEVRIGDAFSSFLEFKNTASPAYLKTLRSRVGSFIEDFGADRNLSEVTAASIDESLRRRVLKVDDDRTKISYNGHLGDIRTFLHWCAKKTQGYILDDPTEGIDKLPVAYEPPRFMRAPDVRRLFDAIVANGSDSDLADAVLSFFCGMRQIEIERSREGEGAVVFNLQDGFISVRKCKGFTRGIRPRTFTIPDQAMAWMRSFGFMAAVMKPNMKFRRHLMAIARDANVELPENAGRKSFITMHTAVYHDQNKLTSIVGNTEDVRVKNYDGLASEKDGREYFAVLPQTGIPN